MHASNPPLVVEESPAAGDVEFAASALYALNAAATGAHDYRPLAIFLRDDAGTITGGLTGFTWGGTLKVEVLWVGEAWRRQGQGSRLLARAEEEARARGCRQAVLETHDFQAPEFYPRHGYTCCGITEDWPVGHRQYRFQKRLEEAADG